MRPEIIETSVRVCAPERKGDFSGQPRKRVVKTGNAHLLGQRRAGDVVVRPADDHADTGKIGVIAGDNAKYFTQLALLILFLLLNRAVRTEIKQQAKPRVIEGNRARAIGADLYMLNACLLPDAG